MDEPSDSTDQTPDDVFRTAVILEMGLGLLAIVIGWVIGPDPRAYVPKWDPSDYAAIGWGVLYGLAATIPLVVFVEAFKRIPWKPIRDLELLGNDGLLKSLLSLSPLELVLISLCAGVGEELLFRGWMLPWMAGGSMQGAVSLWRLPDVETAELWAAIIGSSVAFGLVHPISKLYVVIAGLMGLYFGILMVWSGNLLVPIIAHSAYDAAELLLTSWQSKRQPSS